VRLRLASAPVSWGVDFADDPANPPWTLVLDGIAAAGYRWTELGPAGYLPAPAGPELRRRGLAATGGFVFTALDEPAAVVEAERAGAAVRAAGGRFLVMVDAVADGPRPRGRLLAGIREVADVARRHGLRPLVHPHAATRIEGAEQIRAAMELADLCLDTGHLLYAGIDPVELLRAAPARIPYLHLKDLDPTRVRGDFEASVRAGAFVPLGTGALDLDALFDALDEVGFDGWVVVEQDRRAGAGDPIEDARRSRREVERRLAARAAA
jgi:inosose dehydratase